MIHTVSLREAPSQPWRNGGGSTRELLAWPTPLDWALRISVATIAQHGPFSAFPGVDRWFTVLGGEGVLLRWEDRRARLTPDSEPLHFDGADAPGCELLAGETLDLNLMIRREAGGGAMRRVDDTAWVHAAPLRAVFTLDAASLRIDDAESLSLQPGMLAWSEHAQGQHWQLTGTRRAWWMHLEGPAA